MPQNDLTHTWPQTISAPVTSAPVISAPVIPDQPTLRPLVISAPKTFQRQFLKDFCVLCGYFHYHDMHIGYPRTKCTYYHLVIWLLQNSNKFSFFFLSFFFYLFLNWVRDVFYFMLSIYCLSESTIYDVK